jgi:hypothetical protein
MALPDEAIDTGLRRLRERQLRLILGMSWNGIAGARSGLSLLRECLSWRIPGSPRRLVDSPLLGGWIQDVLFWREVERLAAAQRGAASSAARGIRLFEKIAGSEFLAELVPSGRVERGFAGRAQRHARVILRQRVADLPRILVPYLPPGAGRGAFSLALASIPDEGCSGGRTRLGESPLTLSCAARRAASIRVRRVGRTLFLPPFVEVSRQETVPGTSILLAHRLLSSARGLRVGGPVPRLGARLARGLDLVEGVWPRAGREIRRRTWLIVPLVEPGTVSYSHLARPGISYLSVFRGSLVDLADDLLHETAHHRLHARQEVESLIRDPGEHRFYSPWRRGLRPLNGILHGTFTFLYRAELFWRLSRGGPRPGRARLAAARKRLGSEARRELKRCAASLADLRGASGAGLLTAAGCRLVARMGRRLRALEKGRLSEKQGSIIL